jgi:hypothetical protein
MKAIQAPGLGEYQIIGAREEEAAAAFEEGYRAACRTAGDGDSMLWELAALRRQIAEEYDVSVKLV